MAVTCQKAENVLKPQFGAYCEAIANADWESVAGYYHPNGVVVQAGEKAIYGRDGIKSLYIKFAELTGKSTANFTNTKYEGTGDFIIITSEFVYETEKAGTIKGKFLQIWKKEGDRHLIFHDEFEVVA
ncbi:hypothetical protein CAEBREN_13358 [Caenorhabditis brenneri]|uniref:DUF4440 domain-containing protein n=1 Tax=Caenorhabditis brenneri TaxID=135651 RepID=G0MR67_CAEBE|nr:hypothetical protein CAEBREN_13358 [Caenorhabditis brenneri]